MSRGPYPIMLILAMSLPGAVRALGLGDIRVESALNERLTAQIDIVGATREELAILTASIANREIFQRYGADRPSFLSTASFKVGKDAQGRPVLNVRSTDPFTDPLVSFLVDLRWGRNEVVREYSLLLDPPTYRYSLRKSEVALASVAPPAPAARQASAAPAAAAAPAVAHADHEGVRTQPVAPTASAERASITVATGDTLRAIARRAGARTESEAQSLMIAIFRANPKGFEGNINRLHRGAVLSMPTPAEVAAVSSTEAKREVRAQMTAWRLEGRQGATPRYAAVPAAPSTTTAGAATASVASAADPAGATLANRVQSLEQQLDDMHKLLADENARLQSLQPAAPAAAPAAPAGVIAAAPVAAAPIAAAPIAPAAHPHAAANSAELVRSPILASARANTPSADAQDTQIHLARTAEIFGPVALTLGLMVAGFAYLRRRLSHAPEPEDATAGIAPPPAVPAWEPTAAPAATAYAPAASVPPVDEPISPMEAFRPSAMEESMSRASNETTSNLEIDIEALERSYLESMPGSSATDDAAPVFDGMADDPLLADTAKVEAMHAEGDTEIINAGLKTVLMDVQARDGAMRASDRPEPQAPQKVDFDLVDLDATAQHVHMPSGLNDAPAVAERRTNIVDVLKSAIERDPKRSDLRMKLLETYYTLASSNQRAFMDAVRKLQRERDLLSADDWQKVTMMGRDIAGDDILFADLDLQKNNGDLANCA